MIIDQSNTQEYKNETDTNDQQPAINIRQGSKSRFERASDHEFIWYCFFCLVYTEKSDCFIWLLLYKYNGSITDQRT